METSGQKDFNNDLRNRSKRFATELSGTLRTVRLNEINKSQILQVIRSGTSVASNFHAATRARSPREYYSKLCIVVEECDETIFWFDLLISSGLTPGIDLEPLRKEAMELLQIFSSVRKKMRAKLNP